MNYNELNRHRRDSMIVFEPEEHVYRVGGTEYRPVTTLVEDCFEKFDADFWAERKATPECPAEMLKARWAAAGKEARDMGTRLHDNIERHYLGVKPEAGTDDPAWELFRSFTGKVKLTPYRSEWRIFSEDLLLAGTLDFLAVEPDGTYVLWDWKRSNKVVTPFGTPVKENRFGKRGLGPMAGVPDTSYHHYALQLSIYRHILETKYGISPRAAYLGIFHPDYREPWVVEVPYLREEVASLLGL